MSNKTLFNSNSSINYLYIINNLFSCLHCSPLPTLSSLTSPLTLITICSELNSQTFSEIKQTISQSFSYGIIYSDTSDIINQLQTEIKVLLPKLPSDKIQYFMDFNIVNLLNNDIKELHKLSILLIVYAFNSKNKKVYQIKLGRFPQNIKNDTNKLINEFSENKNDENNNNNNTSYLNGINNIEELNKKDSIIKEQQIQIEKMTQQINELNTLNNHIKSQSESTINKLNEKINLLNDKIKMLNYKKITFKDYNELQDKCKKYDKLLHDYELLKESFNKEKEKETTGESVRSSYALYNKWDLTEQDYLNIILKKDYEIQKLKDELANKSSAEIESNNGNNNNMNVSYILSQNEDEMEMSSHNNYKEEIEQMTKRYEMEFELMSSAMYNLGVNYHKLRNENEELKGNRSSWIIQQKERVMYNEGPYES